MRLRCSNPACAGRVLAEVFTRGRESYDVTVRPRPGIGYRVHTTPARKSWSFDCRCGWSYRVGPDRMLTLVAAANPDVYLEP